MENNLKAEGSPNTPQNTQPSTLPQVPKTSRDNLVDRLDQIKEKVYPQVTKVVSKVKSKLWSTHFLKKMVPYSMGYFFILLGLSETVGTFFTNIFLPSFQYTNISWIYLFIGVDMVGCFSLPLLLIHLKLIRPFWEYGLVYDKLFVCKEVSLFRVMNINFYLPCETQIFIFYAWLFSVLFLFAIRYPPFDKPVYFLGKITYNYFYIALLFVKVVALGMILLSSTPFGMFGSGIIAIMIITLDFIAINVALKKKQKIPNTTK